MSTVSTGIDLKDLGVTNSIKNITNKNQKQIITKSNIPELIELIISSNKEYFNLKDNSIYLTNIIQIYKFKTKLLLDDVPALFFTWEMYSKVKTTWLASALLLTWTPTV